MNYWDWVGQLNIQYSYIEVEFNGQWSKEKEN